MFGKWFKRKSVPSNDGTGDAQGGRGRIGKVFELVLSNMEDSPVYALTHQLSVGSEIGNIVISDPSISPRHATFSLHDEVVSLIDHGSVSGTFINGKKIEAGKNIILEETDTVLIGELEIKIKVSEVSLPAEVIPDAPKEVSVPGPKLESDEESNQESKKENKKIPIYVPKSINTPVKKVVKKKKSLSISKPTSSTNVLVRVFAVAGDFVLAHLVLTIFLPFDEFRLFLEETSSILLELIPVDLSLMVADLGIDLSAFKEIGMDLWELVSSTIHIVPLLLTYVLIRLVTTFIFGITISEFFFGMRSEGNKIWARVGGVLRVIVGLFTWPFLIFDLPAFVSRRTFKEVITFTNTDVPSKFISILGVLFYVPLLFMLCLVAPIAEGLEFPEPVMINDKIDQRVKVKAPANPEVEEPQVTPVEDMSEALNLKVTYDPSKVKIFPTFRFQSSGNKLHLKNSLIFYQTDLQVPVELEVFKTFDLRQLLSYGMKANFLIYDRFPEIYNYVYEADNLSGTFKKNANAKAQQQFAIEVIEFTKIAFSLGLENLLDFVMEESPMIKNYVDYRNSLLGLIEYKDFTDIGFIKLGDTTFMKVIYKKQKPFDLLIPLQKAPGKILKVNYAKKENAAESGNKFYKFNLNKSEWMAKDKMEKKEVLSGLQVFDLFSGKDVKRAVFEPLAAQALYGYFYESSADILNRNDPVEKELWKTKLQSLVEVIEKLPVKNTNQEAIDAKTKLLQNFKDSLDAFSNNNLDYFGVKATTQI